MINNFQAKNAEYQGIQWFVSSRSHKKNLRQVIAIDLDVSKKKKSKNYRTSFNGICASFLTSKENDTLKLIHI